MHKIPTLAACLVLAAATFASARPLTPKEKGYVRALQHQVGLERIGVKALASKSGAAGVKVRFKGLTVVRLHFPSAHSAQRYAARPALRGLLKQVDLRGKEVVLLGGERLRDPAEARTYLGAAWGTSLDAPSKTTKRPLVIKRADGTVLRLRPILRKPAPPARSSAVALGGTYYLVGSGRVVIDQVKGGPDGTKCRITFKGSESRSYPALFDGQVLAIDVSSAKEAGRLGKHEPSEVIYVWTPDSSGGGAFSRSGSPSQAIPQVSERFWRSK
jgi:hypothetical protein